MTAGEIRKTIVVDAPPGTVFRALTDEKELVKWMPQEARMEARVGGEYEFRYHWAQRGLDAVATGRILELVPEKRLSYTFVSSRSGSGSSLTDSVVTWTLDELPDGKTRVTVVHSGITREVYGDTDAGWGYYTSQLARHSREMAGSAGDA
jgi:uncharacterized protein YndB with AHSA1/START domain